MPHFITQIVSCSIDRDRLLSAEASEVLSLMGCIITTLPPLSFDPLFNKVGGKKVIFHFK